jgi:hypothetical protein
MDRGIKTIRQLEHVFEPYRKVFKELKRKTDRNRSSSNYYVSAKKRKTI